MPGRPKTPDEKRKLGTYQPHRDAHKDPPKYGPIPELPPPPAWLVCEYAQAEWNATGPLIMQILTSVDLTSLAQLCALRGEWQRAAAEEGKNLAAAKIVQLRIYETEFGLTPASRAKVNVARGPKAEESKFGRRGRRRAG